MTAPARFIVKGDAGPQTLARLVNYIAQLGMTPRRVRADEADGVMTVLIEVAGLGDHQAGIIADKMRTSVLVSAVRLTRGRRILLPLSEQVK